MLNYEDALLKILNIADVDSTVEDVSIEGNIKSITVTKNKPDNNKCPICGSLLHSKGLFKRTPNDQILQDGYIVNLTVIGRRWKCSNPDCSYTCSDQFDFLDKRKRTTKIIPLLILSEFKDINLSCIQIAQKFNISDTYAYQIFMSYVDLPRKKLTQYICIDEVYMNFSPTCKYALVIMDFETGDILDIIKSRRKQYTEDYFLSIKIEERDLVKFLICDMYDPYVNYTSKYFHNAKAITDSFHVLQWLISLIRNYINAVKKKYQQADKQRLKEKNRLNNSDNRSIKESKEVYILRKAQWVILRNPKKWFYTEPRYVQKLQRIMDTVSWEKEFLALDDNFRTIRNLKNLYEDFNDRFINDPDGASERLDELIEIYQNSELSIFQDFARLLKKYHESIIASFTYITITNNESREDILKRLSNGPMESFNNIPSALRTQSHGVSNFEYTRNRILWYLREDAAILGKPKTKEEIHRPGTKRGEYEKHKK